jgi:uncharacterized membrane protein YhhN
MKNKQLVVFSTLYFLIGCADLYFVASGKDGRIFVKPFLMLLLSVLFFQQVKSNYVLFAKLIQAALFFSWAGDVVLLFTGKSEKFFIGGLIFFLVAHIFYIMAFYKVYSDKKVTMSVIKKIVICACFVLYMLYIFNILIASLGSMLIPVLIYTMVITVMGIFAGLNAANYKSGMFATIFAGAVLFIVSDTELAFEKFVQPISHKGFTIMVTYIFAQYLIVFGSINYLTARLFWRKNNL